MIARIPRTALPCLLSIGFLACAAEQAEPDLVSVSQALSHPDLAATAAIDAKERSLGAAVTGALVLDTASVLDGAAFVKRFDLGCVVYSEDHGAVWMPTDVYAYWEAKGLETHTDGTNLQEYLGTPESDGVVLATHTEYRFSRGRFFVFPSAIVGMYGRVMATYDVYEAELGLPTAEQVIRTVPAADPADDDQYFFESQEFANGVIQSGTRGRTFALWGDVLNYWVSQGGATGSLGKPKSSVQEIEARLDRLSDDVTPGQTAKFEGGVVYGSVSSPYTVISSVIAQAYADSYGGPSGYFGFPTGIGGSSRGGLDTYAEFSNGLIIDHAPDNGARNVAVPFGNLDLTLVTLESWGNDCTGCGQVDLFMRTHVTVNGVLVHDNVRGGDTDDGNYQNPNQGFSLLLAPGPARLTRADTTIHVKTVVWDADTPVWGGDDDKMGTPQKTFNIDNLWGYIGNNRVTNGEAAVTMRINNDYDYDNSDFRASEFWAIENFSTDELTYEQFTRTFSDAVVGESPWWNPINAAFYWLLYEDIAETGNCFGMATESVFAQAGRSPYNQPIYDYKYWSAPGSASEFEPDEDVEHHQEMMNVLNIKQGYQLGSANFLWFMGEVLAGNTDNYLDIFERSWDSYKAGEHPILSMFEGGGGHTLRPYRWDPTNPCTYDAGKNCKRIYVADPNWPKITLAAEPFIEIEDDGDSEEKFRFRAKSGAKLYEGTSSDGYDLMFVPDDVLDHAPMTPTGLVAHILSGGVFYIMGSEGATTQVTDGDGRTYYGQGGGDQIPNLAAIPLMEGGGGQAMLATESAGKTLRFETGLAAGATDGDIYQAVVMTNALSVTAKVPGTIGESDEFTIHETDTEHKSFSFKVNENVEAKTIELSVTGANEEKWRTFKDLEIQPGQTIGVRLRDDGNDVVFTNDGAETTATMFVPNELGDEEEVGVLAIASGETSFDPLGRFTPESLGCVDETLNGKEYWFCSDSLPWEGAKDQCESVGLDLVRVNSSEENSFVQSHFTGPIWLGANHLAERGVWQWTDGTQFRQGDRWWGKNIGNRYDNFDHGEPNNRFWKEHCAEMQDDGTWRDTKCKETKLFACTTPPVVPEIAPGNNCGYEEFGDHGYWFCKDELDWTSAEASCLGAGGDLVKIDDVNESHFVAENIGDEAWIGATDTEEGVWRWQDGVQFWQGKKYGNAVAGQYANWARFEPNDWLWKEDCAVARSQSGWEDKKCSAANDFVCEMPTVIAGYTPAP
ncbi:MAG: hypothetical protein HRU17_17915 [Polyangiaceae bacterium]|nr:hypothetical protein [Polyangiaceae bacterium]